MMETVRKRFLKDAKVPVGSETQSSATQGGSDQTVEDEQKSAAQRHAESQARLNKWAEESMRKKVVTDTTSGNGVSTPNGAVSAPANQSQDSSTPAKDGA